MHIFKVKRLFQLTSKLKRDGTMGIHRNTSFTFQKNNFEQSQVGDISR